MSIKDYEGGIITKNPTTPTGPYQNGAASGVWTMDQAAEYTKQGVWPIAGNVPSYVDDVFSTYLYEGTGSTQTITNGIDLAGEGGWVWTKQRSLAGDHWTFNTESGVPYATVRPNLTNSQFSGDTTLLTSFNSDGFTLGADTSNRQLNTSGTTMVSWTFRKQAGFFDVVTYTGNGTAGRTVSHNLGSVPGCIIVKRTDSANGWAVYHRAMDATAPEDWMMRLNATDARFDLTPSRWNDTAPTSTDFTLSDNDEVNGSGGTYVAYLFAHDDQRFGDNGDESIIKCGTYGPGTETLDGPEVTLGWEPQWVLVKAYDNTGNWSLFDNMRGVVTNGDDKYLRPNGSNAELTAESIIFTPTGFKITSIFSEVNQSGINYIYIAIRRPMKTPTAATEVFTPALASSSGDYTAVAGFPVDMNIYSQRSSANNHFTYDRLRGGPYLATDSTSGEAGDFADWDSNTSFIVGGVSGDYSDYINWMFKRATGFFDVVAYTGDGAASQTLNHNLGVTPDIITVKKRSSSGSQWPILVRPTADSMYLNTNNAGFGAYYYIDNPTSTTFDVQTDGSAPQSNQSGETYIAYLFATLAGISKVGSYTGTAANLDVDCGFTSGARFILIKRTDSTGDWYVYDSVRGIVSGNDPYLLINTTDAEVTGTDYIDPLSSGFTVTSSAPAGLNASGGTYIFLAIA
jgi:hypothetical protein